METQNHFSSWIEDNLEEYLPDISRHGADQGYPHITYYSDTVALYDKFHEDIWDKLYVLSWEFGLDHPIALIASFGGAGDVANNTQFKNLLVWFYVENYTHEWCARKEEEEYNTHPLPDLGE